MTTTKEFDLLGGTAAELQRRAANNNNNNNAEMASSAIPGPIPDELIVPAEDPIGIRLLRVMVLLEWLIEQIREKDAKKSNRINCICRDGEQARE